jgi:hypothetical protein
LEIGDLQELAAVLKTTAPDVTFAAVDSDGTGKYQTTVVKIQPLLSHLGG